MCAINNLFGQYQQINRAGLTLYYRSIGDGKPILIVGGGPGDASDRYLSLCSVLSNDFQCILIEQRGCGKSVPVNLDSTTISIELTLADFEQLRKHLGFEKWNVLGFSYGGFLASLYAHFFPESIESLILMDSMGLNTDVFDYFLDNINSRLQPADLEAAAYWSDSARVLQNPHHAIVEKIKARMPGYFYDREKASIVVNEMKDSHFNFEMGIWIWKDVFKRKLDLKKMSCNFYGPVLILHGRQDPVGESVPQELCRYYNNSKLVIIEKSGHYSWIEQPGKVLTAITEFIDLL